MSSNLWWWIAPAVLLFWSVGAHNRLVRLRAAVLQAFATLDAQLLRWIAMAPPPAAELAGPQWEGLRAAGAQLGASLAAARGRPLDADAAAALTAAVAVLRAAWIRQAQEESAAAPPAGFGALWEPQDTQARLACEQFNAAVLRYNAALSQFPAALLGWLMRFRPGRPL